MCGESGSTGPGPYRDRLRDYLELCCHWALETDARGIITFCYKTSGCSDPRDPGDLVGKELSGFLPEKSLPELSPLLEAQRYAFPGRFCFPIGEDCELRGIALRDASGFRGFRLLLVPGVSHAQP